MSNDWNLLSLEKPPVGTPLIVTVYDSGRCRNELRYPVYYGKSLYSDEYVFTMLSHEGVITFVKEYTKVIAWQKLPQIYEEIF